MHGCAMSRRERERAYRRLKRVRSDLRVAVRKMSRSHGKDADLLERRVHLLTKRKRKLKRRFAPIKEDEPTESKSVT